MKVIVDYPTRPSLLINSSTFFSHLIHINSNVNVLGKTYISSLYLILTLTSINRLVNFDIKMYFCANKFIPDYQWLTFSVGG